MWAYPVADRQQIDRVENALFHQFHAQSALMNGKIPPRPAVGFEPPSPLQRVQVMSDAEIAEKRDPALRLPRQAEHYSQIVGHFLAVKNSREVALAMQAHFDRLRKYHGQLLGFATDVEGDGG